MIVFLWCVAFASSATVVSAAVAPCSQWDATWETYNEVMRGDSKLITCRTGKITAIISYKNKVAATFDNAWCMADGTWFGTSCDGTAYIFDHTQPLFHCPDVILPEPLPCECEFRDIGAALNMPPPTSLCTNGVNQVLQCDDKIYVESVDGVMEYDRVTCSDGQWYGTGCNGALTYLSSASVDVQCSKEAEPPLCPQIPSRGGLIYIGMAREDTMQRYTCREGEIIKILLSEGTNLEMPSTFHAKYFDCNTTRIGISSFDDEVYAHQNPILEISCRDHSSFNQVCSVPITYNAWHHDGIIECAKGSHLSTIKFEDNRNGRVATFGPLLTAIGSANDDGHVQATCAIDGWTIGVLQENRTRLGHVIKWAQLIEFDCLLTRYYERDRPKGSSCPQLKLAENNLQYFFNSDRFECWNIEEEEMKVVDPTGTLYYGFNLQCVSGVWKFTGNSTVTIPAGSSVSCFAKDMPILPPDTLPLIFLGRTFWGEKRLTCSDASVVVEIAEEMNGAITTMHGPYLLAEGFYSSIDQFRIASSVVSENFTSEATIFSVKCVDMGPKHHACTDPWVTSGIRIGNRYECEQGYYLNFVEYINNWGILETVGGFFDPNMRSMHCNKDGWQVEGTALTGLRVVGFSCAYLHSVITKSNTTCDKYSIAGDPDRLQFDSVSQMFTCNEGQTLRYYTFYGEHTEGYGKKLFCGKNSSGSSEWQWAFMDGTGVSAIPVGAIFDCLTPV